MIEKKPYIEIIRGTTGLIYADRIDENTQEYINITSHDCICHIRKELDNTSELYCECSVSNGYIVLGTRHVGSIDITIPASVTAQWAWDRAYYTINLTYNTTIYHVSTGIIVCIPSCIPYTV